MLCSLGLSWEKYMFVVERRSWVNNMLPKVTLNDVIVVDVVVFLTQLPILISVVGLEHKQLKWHFKMLCPSSPLQIASSCFSCFCSRRRVLWRRRRPADRLQPAQQQAMPALSLSNLSWRDRLCSAVGPPWRDLDLWLCLKWAYC